MTSMALQTFPRSARSPRDARRFVAGVLSSWRVGDACAAALLALSELVTNAVTHGRGVVCVRVALRRSVLRIEVEDEGVGLPAGGPGPAPVEPPAMPPPAMPPADSIGGRGLHIVAEVADAWGHTPPGGDTSVVWFETLCPERAGDRVVAGPDDLDRPGRPPEVSR